MIILSKTESEKFLSLLEYPPEPTQELKDLMADRDKDSENGDKENHDVSSEVPGGH